MKRPKKGVRAEKRLGKRQTSEATRTTERGPGGLAVPVVSELQPIADQPTYNREIVTASADETFELGRSLAAELKGQTVILLSGDLGAGKTVFAKGVGAGLDIDPADITSPSFAIINVHDGRLRLYHIDLYRLDSSRCANLGLEDIFNDPGAVVVIEWAERLPSIPHGAIRVLMAYEGDNARKILIGDHT